MHQSVVFSAIFVDSLVTVIGSNTIALQFDEIVSSLLMEEMRRKNMES